MSQENQIQDSSSIEAYLQKRNEWFDWYEGANEPNSIKRQIHLMIFSEMSYRVLRQERDRDPNSENAIPAIAYLTDNGYLSAQVLAIRKLLDKANDVLSIGRLIKDLKKHKGVITREAFVAYDGTPYEPGEPEILVPGLQPEDSPFSAWARSTRRHSLFDRLSALSGDDRARNNLIHDDIFSKLEHWIDSSGASELILLCNKHLAHAADAASRGDFVISGISFEQVEAVQKTLVRVSKAIFDLILTSGVYSTVVMSPPLGYFGRVWSGDNLVPKVKRMDSDWDDLEKIRNEWPNGLEDDLLN